MSTNKQVWQVRPGEPGTIKDSPVPNAIEDDKLLVKVHAWAINPCDAMLQDKEFPIKYPVILGQDIAGVVELVGSKAAGQFQKGDRVFGFTFNNGFQEYAPVSIDYVAKIPNDLPYTDVCVFGLACTTSAYALFASQYLGLPLPKFDSEPTGKSLLVWGGSSALGSNAIQLATAAGLDVYTTCSPRNFDYVRRLGAVKAFDYNAEGVIDDIVASLDQGTCAGICFSAGSVADACQVAHRSKQHLRVVSSNPIAPGDCPEGVELLFLMPSPGGYGQVLPAIWKGYLVEALGKGKYQIAPPPQILDIKGIQGIQPALDLQKKGVSGTRLVVQAE